MSKESVPAIIYRKRYVEKRSSFSQLESELGINRATIRRYEKGESTIPRRVAKAFAKMYFDSSAEREEFLEQWKNESAGFKHSTSSKSTRRKECTMAQKFFEARLHIGAITQFSHGRKKPRRKYAGSWISIGIHNKETNSLVFHIDPSAFVFVDSQSSKEKHRFKLKAIDSLIEFSGRHRIGKYAIVDLAKREVEKSNLFNAKTYEQKGSKTNPVLLLDAKSLDNLFAIINKKRGSKSVKEWRECVEEIEVQLSFIRDRASEDLLQYKEKLLRKIGFVNNLISERLNPSTS